MIEVVVEEPAWTGALPDFQQISETAHSHALQAAGLIPDKFAVSLLACGDDQIAALNAGFRNKAGPTNVLSWPATDLAPTVPGQPPQLPEDAPVDGRTPLGDVAIAFQTCKEEALSASIPLKNHVTHLILHGCLHLLGYDHQTDEDAAIMEGLERDVLAGIGIPDPYA